MKKKSNYRPWAERIIEISMKSLLELNTEFSILTLPHHDKIKGNIIKSISNNGFELIDERQVCSKIIQNSLSSFLFSGSWQKEVKPDVKEGFRFWEFHRELGYLNKEINGYCDIVLDRIFFDGNNIDKMNQPVYIEAKRAKTKSITDLNSGIINITKNYNYYDCFDDILKLVSEKDYVIKENIYKNMFCHLLIWGDTEDPIKDNPTKCNKYLNRKLASSELKDYKLEIHQVRWFPLDRIDTYSLKSDHRIKKWGWVSLMEIIRRL